MVSDLGAVFKATKVVVVAHYSGLTVAQMQTLRRQMKQAGASVKVAKNRLAKIALEGSEVASIGSLLKGPGLIAYSGVPLAAPKVGGLLMAPQPKTGQVATAPAAKVARVVQAYASKSEEGAAA